MTKFTQAIKRIMLLAPIAAIVIVSFLPLQVWVRQTLVLFTLIWFNTFIIFNVLGK